MTLATRCTGCGTVFRVVQDQLRVSAGWVRCGRCSAVFNAIESLVDVASQAPAQATATRDRVMQDLQRVAGHPAGGGARVGPPGGAGDAAAGAPSSAVGAGPLGVSDRMAGEPLADQAAPAPAAMTTATVPAVAPAARPPAAIDGERDDSTAMPDSPVEPPVDERLDERLDEGAASTPPAGAAVAETGRLPPSPTGDRDLARPDAAGAFGDLDAAGAAAGSTPHASAGGADVLGDDAIGPPESGSAGDALGDAVGDAGEAAGTTGRAVTSGGAEADNAAELVTSREPVASGASGASTEQGARSEQRERSDQAGDIGVRGEDRVAVGQVDADGPAAQVAPLPTFVRQADRAARWRRPWVRAVLALLALAGTGGLVVQGALLHHDLMAARWPAVTPALAHLCDWAGCTLGPPRRIDGLAVLSSTLVRGDGPGRYRLGLTLRNREPIDVRMPAFELTLSDAGGRLLVRRVLSAAELGEARDRLAAGAEVVLDGTLLAGAEPVVGYTIEIFYP